MKKEVQVANYLVQTYENITDTRFGSNELMLQKLMYFAQKTSLAMTGKALFSEEFEGWKHGPVLRSLRFYFDEPVKLTYSDLTEEEKYIIDNTVYCYGKYSAWALRELSHEEYSWKKSREGLSVNDSGSKSIPLEDILEDAKKVRLIDHQFDMYLDEFEDIEGSFVSIG